MDASKQTRDTGQDLVGLTLALEGAGGLVGLLWPLGQAAGRGDVGCGWAWPCLGLAAATGAEAWALSRGRPGPRENLRASRLLAALWAPLLFLLAFPLDHTTIEFGPINDWLNALVSVGLAVTGLSTPLVLRLARRRVGSIGKVTYLLTAAAVWVGVVGILVGVLTATPKGLWIALHPPTKRSLIWTLLVVYLALAWLPALARGRHGRFGRAFYPIQNLLLALCLLVCYWVQETAGSPDKSFWLDIAKTSRLYSSELLSGALLHGLHKGWDHQEVTGPIWGALTALVFLWFCDRHFVRGRPGWAGARIKAFCATVYLASGIHLFFFRGYVETTYPGLPFAIVSLHWLARYAGARERAWGRLAAACAWLTLACLFHGQYCFLLPALGVVVAMRHWRRGTAWTLPGEAAVGGATIVALAGLTILALRAGGFHLEPGNYWGGGDGMRFTPLRYGVWVGDHSQGRAGIRYLPLSKTLLGFTLLAWDHWAQWANILLLGAPTGLFVIGPLAAEAGRGQRRGGEETRWILSLMALSYLGFIFFWRFDFGFPGDYDLMLSMSPVLNLWVLAQWRETAWRHPGLSLSAGLAATVYSWAIVTQYLK